MQTAAVQTVALVLATGPSDPAPEADDVTAGTWGWSSSCCSWPRPSC